MVVLMKSQEVKVTKLIEREMKIKRTINFFE